VVGWEWHPGGCVRGIGDEAAREHGHFEPNIRHRTTDAIVMLRLVAHGGASGRTA
jgi:hypothetical protein